ncbi:hypothetical protein [Caulobacter segnis]|uniref:hypothetical protein n=1 Tax=Caulobacter segnis TaxID=88688 RepID=UPI001CBF9F96|nr:hypothetical protein [Caulobacter segnis]UAL10187.1 hypothetical protein K8940_20855 [Caulobacter segnis]
MGKRAEICGVGQVAPGGAARLRERLPRLQAQISHHERRLGLTHDFRLFLFDGDTRLWFGFTYDGEFCTWLADLCDKSPGWLDSLFDGVWEGFPGATSPFLNAFLRQHLIGAELFFTAFPEASRHDIDKALRGREALGVLLDAIS